jgi:hypothetical protein
MMGEESGDLTQLAAYGYDAPAVSRKSFTKSLTTFPSGQPGFFYAGQGGA